MPVELIIWVTRFFIRINVVAQVYKEKTLPPGCEVKQSASRPKQGTSNKFVGGVGVVFS